MSKLTISVNKKPKAFEPYTINGFLISKPLTSDNSGFSKWGFCTKDGKEYFIKEFLNPVYPAEDIQLEDDIRQRKIGNCMEWYNKKKELYSRLLKSQTGNLIIPMSFFRYESHFYIVTEKVEKSDLDLYRISTFTGESKRVIMKVLASCFMRLAQNGVVHADVKPDNLLIKETANGFFTVKVIDFDASYLESDPPFGDEVMGDPVYYAPETFLAIMEDPVPLTSKVDVFGLGLIFHQVLCGALPSFSEEYDYAYEAVLNGEELTLNESIPESFRSLIGRMTCCSAEERISIGEVFDILSAADAPKPAKDTGNAPASRWKIADSFD